MKLDINKMTDSTPAFEEYIEKKFSSLGRLLKGFEDKNEVELSLDVVRATKHHIKGDEVYLAKGSVRLNKKIIYGEEYASDARSAVDKLCDTLKVEINKYKNQLKELIKK